MKRRILSIISLLAVVLLGGMALLVPAGASTEPGIAQEQQPVPDLDPAALNLGNSDAGAMMAMINRAISLHD